MSGLFGEIMAELFAYQKDAWEPLLRKMGFYMGKFIYLLDAYEDVEEEDVQEIDDVQPDNTYHKKLIEETQQLRVQMDEYEEELTDLSDGVEKTNKLLNFVLCFLILVLLVVIGFIGYSIWKAGGFNL